MDISTDDFRRHYASLSDEALLEIDAGDLVEAARACHQAEVESRGLSVAPAAVEDAATEGGEEGSGDLATVAVYETRGEADLARALLHSAGIPSGFDKHGLTLIVPASFLEQAYEVLDATVSDEELAAQAEAAGADSEDQPS